MKQLNIKYLLGCAAALMLGAPHAAISKEIRYNCPDLQDTRKQKIGALFQGYDGWFFRDVAFQTDFSLSPQTQQYFQRFNEALSKRGISFIFLPLPSRTFMAPEMLNQEQMTQTLFDLSTSRLAFKEFIDTLKSLGIITTNLDEAFQQYADGDAYTYNFKRDIHWKPEGAKFFAQFVANLLKDMPDSNTFSTVDVKMVDGGAISRGNAISDELLRLCVDQIPLEELQVVQRKQSIDKNANALFGSDDSATPISIIGTSFSAMDEFGFAGFIEELSGYEVANYAIAGGLRYTSAISYLSTPYFQENTPPAIIWEAQGIYNFNKGSEQNFRQLIPAVSGKCSAPYIVEKNTVSITKDGTYTLLNDVEKKDIQGTDYYLYMHTDNESFNEFKLTFEYKGGDGEIFPIDRSERYRHRGHYFVELSDKIEDNLSSIQLTNTSGNSSSIDILLCQKKPEMR